MRRSRQRMLTYSLGSVLAATLVLGGGTAPGLVSDTILQVAIVIICGGILVTKQSTVIDWRVFALPLLALGAVILQLVPIPIGLASRFWPDAVVAAWQAAGGGGYFGVLSVNVGRTLTSLTYVATAAVLAWTLGSLHRDQLSALVPYLIVGVLANAFAGLFQMSLSQFEPIHGLLPYTIKAGFFANVNHFSTLLLMSIPPIVLSLERGQRLLPIVALGVVLLLLLAAGSIAGIMIGFSITALSLLLLTPVRLTKGAMVAGAVAVAAAFAFGAWRHVSAENFDAPFGRLDFLKTALLAIKDSPMFGTGYGTFVQTYQIYELPKDIYSEYVNHAHNEYAELIMEGGLVAAILIAVYLLFLGMGVFERRDHATVRAAFLSIVVVLVHSLVDYPLRTMAIMSCFIFANAMIFTHHAMPRRAASVSGEPGHGEAADSALPVAQQEIRPERFRETEQLREEIERLMSQTDSRSTRSNA